MVIIWFRQDLRLADNPALYKTASEGAVMPVYVLDDESPGEFRMGEASRLWLHYSLESLNRALGGKLNVYCGNAAEVIPAIARKNKAKAVFWNECYELWRRTRDAQIVKELESSGIKSVQTQGSLLWGPESVVKSDGSPYQVFTAFYKKASIGWVPDPPLPQPKIQSVVHDDKHSLCIDDLELRPKLSWHLPILKSWEIGEPAAQQRLSEFLAQGLDDYADGRNLPGKKGISRLSPALHFGELSPRQIWCAASARRKAKGLGVYLSELGWREFSYYLLYHFAKLPEQNLQSKFDGFPWHHDAAALTAWQKGLTGIPIVDAGMRELWLTGFMHNRVRMITASFLTKNLLIDWRKGRDWFWDTLLDADLASNSAGWQWVAGCGVDAAPYFRIFNPVSQGQKFDQDGTYTKKYVPELSKLPLKYLFCPWEAPEGVLAECGVRLGGNYPRPIVDLKATRERALLAFRSLRPSDSASVN